MRVASGNSPLLELNFSRIPCSATMFHMEFQSQVTDEGNEASHSMTESVYEPAIFEGRVGRFGKVHRVSHSDRDRLAPWMSRILPSNGRLPGNWKEAELVNSTNAPCLQGVTQDEATQQAIFLDTQVLRELVRPFAELQHGTAGNVRGDGEETSSISSGDSMRSDSSFRSDLSSASEGSVAEMNALQRESKPWEEPLLALHQQVWEAKEEAERLADEESREAARAQRELRDLANCVDLSPSQGSFKRNKLQKVLSKTGVTAVCRFLKNPFGLFKSPKIRSGFPTREGVNAVVMPRRAVRECSPANAALSQMQSVPRRQAQSEIQFATVNSTQRDVPAWTMEEYMTRNGRVRRRDDEEFGAIEGNNLMNQYFDDDMQPAYDSDSD